MTDVYEIEVTVRDAKGAEAKGHAEYQSDATIGQVPHELLQHVVQHAGESRMREINEAK